ncbi:MAG: archaeal proteasome endopeptidase complex subunit beta [Thermoplasmata archaeon]
MDLHGVESINGRARTLSSGTTTIGLVCKDGVVLATERRATMGSFIANKATVKMFRIDKTIGATLAGSLGDAQVLIRYMQAEVALYRMRRGASVRVEGAATLTANILNTNRYTPYLAWLIVGGMDASGGHVFALDAGGGCTEDRFVSIGSGSPFVYGVFEDAWKETPTVTEGIDLSLRGLSSAMKRDSASGDGYAVSEITQSGYRELEPEEIRKRLSRLKLV